MEVSQNGRYPRVIIQVMVLKPQVIYGSHFKKAPNHGLHPNNVKVPWALHSELSLNSWAKIWNILEAPKNTDLEDHFDVGSDHFDHLFCDFHSSAAQNHLFFSGVFIRQSFSHIVSSCVSSATSFGWRCLYCQVGGNIHRISQRAATLHDILPNFPHRVRDGQTRQGAAASKSTISNLSHRLQYGQTRQRLAARKSTISNLSHRLRYGQTRQRLAARKSTISNLSHRLRYGQTRQRLAARKSTISNLSHRLRYGQTRQRLAARKSTISNLSHRLRYGQTRQRLAARKSTISNLSHRLRYGQTRQRLAARKSTISNLSHRLWDGQTSKRGAVTKCTISKLSHRLWDGQTRQRGAARKSKSWNLSHRLRYGQTRQRLAARKSTISNLSHRLWDGQTSQRGAVTKCTISKLSHRLWDGQTSQRGACTKCTISNLSHRPRDGQTPQRAAARKSIRPNLSDRLRDNQSQQALAVLEGMWLDGCSARDAYVTQFLHRVAKIINTLNCRLDIEDNLHVGRVEDTIWDGHLKIIQPLPVKDKLHGAEYPGDLILWWMENLHFFFQLSDRHFWPHCQGVNVATKQFHIDVSCHRNTNCPSNLWSWTTKVPQSNRLSVLVASQHA